MAYTLKDAKKEFILTPIVQEFITRKMCLISYAINNDLVSLDDVSINDFRQIETLHNKIEIHVIDEDIPQSSKMALKLLAEMSSIPCRLFYIDDNEIMSEKEIKDTLELDLFSIENFMSLWNIIVSYSKKEIPDLCEKFSSL